MNTYYKNLAWKTKEERKAFNKTDPNYRSRAGVRHYSKLSEAQVKLIKRKLNDPNRKTRMKLLARQFGISEMQLYRIKSGKNWSDVEPIEENK
jgi:DNA-binding phage protein